MQVVTPNPGFPQSRGEFLKQLFCEFPDGITLTESQEVSRNVSIRKMMPTTDGIVFELNQFSRDAKAVIAEITNQQCFHTFDTEAFVIDTDTHSVMSVKGINSIEPDENKFREDGNILMIRNEVAANPDVVCVTKTTTLPLNLKYHLSQSDPNAKYQIVKLFAWVNLKKLRELVVQKAFNRLISKRRYTNEQIKLVQVWMNECHVYMMNEHHDMLTDIPTRFLQGNQEAMDRLVNAFNNANTIGSNRCALVIPPGDGRFKGCVKSGIIYVFYLGEVRPVSVSHGDVENVTLTYETTSFEINEVVNGEELAIPFKVVDKENNTTLHLCRKQAPLLEMKQQGLANRIAGEDHTLVYEENLSLAESVTDLTAQINTLSEELRITQQDLKLEKRRSSEQLAAHREKKIVLDANTAEIKASTTQQAADNSIIDNKLKIIGSTLGVAGVVAVSSVKLSSMYGSNLAAGVIDWMTVGTVTSSSTFLSESVAVTFGFASAASVLAVAGVGLLALLNGDSPAEKIKAALNRVVEVGCQVGEWSVNTIITAYTKIWSATCWVWSGMRDIVSGFRDSCCSVIGTVWGGIKSVGSWAGSAVSSAFSFVTSPFTW